MIIREFGCSEKMLRSLIVFVLASSCTVLSSSKKHAYHGVIREDAPEGAEVELDQPLNARTGEICSYTVFSSVPNLPFKVIQEDLTGEVKIVLGSGFQLDYETRSQYDFQIEAHSCNANAHSQKESVHIEVEDVDDLDPDWKQRSYYAEVVEGKIYDRLVHLEAAEPDGYVAISEVCRYRILTPDMPFQVDADGYLRNTEPLDYNRKHSYALEVAAIDCNSHKSDKIFVNIEVKALCRPGWIGLQDRVEFSPREGRKMIAPEAELELCDGHCNLTRIAVTAKLTTTHIGKGCDRDTYSLQSQRKLCGASDGTIDLLPGPSVSGGWTKDLPTDDGQESDQIFAFDGRMTAVEIPQSRVDPNIGRQFTISTWMKHEDEDVEEDSRKGKGRGGHKGIKEHILCHSDGEEMNRQHYALYVHNCRLVLLLRREPGSNVDMNSLRPGEWRWKLPEVCDKKWHHYAISITFPEVVLYVDGKRFIESKHNPEILDEWPLHPTKHVHFTKLVVGACWLGGKNHMGHFFRGYLAGLSILKNRTESDHVIQCLNTCQEKLDFPGIDDMENGMTVSMNNEMTTITVSGITVDSVEKLLQRITYINSRTFPTPGHRPFSMETQATCSDGKVLPVDSIKTLIMVLEPEKPIIVVKAAKVFERDEHGLVHGEKIFHNLTISAFTKTEENERMDADEKDGETIDSGDTSYMLDSCLIRVNPQMNLDVEHFRYPENLLTQLRMEADISEDGLVIAGADKLSNYEEVLRGIRYVNARPEELNSRTFILTCTELNGRFVSNQLDVTIEVNHVQHERTAAPQAIAVHKVLQPQAEISHHDRSAKVDKKNSDTQTVTGIVIMCVVCAGFIVLLVVLGVMRIRNARRHIHDVNVEEKQEMEWDNSALTITVNPMDQEALYDETYDQGLRCGDSDSDDEGSLHEPEAESSDGEPEEEEETEKAKTKELEWDDSTLSF